MRIGIVAEGPSDIAVLLNILHGKLGVERKDVTVIRPELSLDETDLSARRKGGYQKPTAEQFSNWALVLKECRERARIREFIDSPIEGERLAVIHIDTAEAHLAGFDVKRPDRGAPGYVEELRGRVVAKLEGLLGRLLSRRSRFAVAVEETDAWLLALYEGKGDTGLIVNPKKKLEHLQKTSEAAKESRSKERSGGKKERGESRQDRPKKRASEIYAEMSEGFRDPQKLGKYAGRNVSLRLFVDSLDA